MLAHSILGERWMDARHSMLLDQALVYLEQRQAPAWFLRKLSATTQVPEDAADDDLLPFLRLIVEEPPRHGKSEHGSRFFTAWYLGRNPSHHVILSSYESDYARSGGRKARDVLERVGEQEFGIAVSKRTAAANDWEINEHGGGMITAGVGGAITGRGANLLVVDDPVKNAQEAASETLQQRNYDWWRSTAYTRLETDEQGREGIVLVIQTRWHEQDLAGAILADEEGLEDDETWYTLKLPAIAEVDDPLGREPGEALWPERYPLDRLERIRDRIGTYFFSALYQQRPSPEQGNIFMRSWWQYYDSLPNQAWVQGYIFIDTAGYDDKTTGDYAVLAPVVRIGRDLYWLDSFQRGHWTFPELVQRAEDLHQQTGLPICIEDVPWAAPLKQTLEQRVRAVVPFKVQGVNKQARAMAASPYAEAGTFWLPRNARWVSAFVEEHAAFPNGAHDDMVDTTSMAAIRMLRPAMPTSAAPSARPAPMRNAGWRSV